MFYDELKFTNTVFTLPVFDRFHNVQKTKDETGIMLLKALLYRRLPEGEEFNYAVTDDTAWSINEIREGRGNFLHIVKMPADDTGAEDKTPFDVDADKVYRDLGATGIEPIEDFLKMKEVYVKLYIFAERQAAVLVMRDPSSAQIHLALSFIPRYLPAFFKDRPLTKDERDLCMSLTETEPGKFKTLIGKYEDIEDFRKERLQQILERCVSGTRERRIDGLRDAMVAQQDRVRDVEETLNELLMELREKTKRYNEATNLPAEELDKDLLSYLARSKSIDMVGQVDETLMFYVCTKLDIFNEDFWNGLAHKGQIYTGYTLPTTNPFNNRENAELLLNAIFGTAELSVKLVSYMELNLSGSIRSERGHEYPNKYKDYLPNPHMQIHNCFGQSRQYITNAILAGDLMQAFDQCVMTGSTVDLGETPQTLRPMIDWILKSKNKILLLPDGTSVTPQKALEYLKAKTATTEKKDEAE